MAAPRQKIQSGRSPGALLFPSYSDKHGTIRHQKTVLELTEFGAHV